MDHGWLQVRVKCFVPAPPSAAIRKEIEYPASHVKPEDIVSNSGKTFSGIAILLTIPSGLLVEV